MSERCLIHYDPASDKLVLTLSSQANRTVYFSPRDWHLCAEVIKTHYLEPDRYLHRRRAVKSLAQTDRKMIDQFLRNKQERAFEELYKDAIDIELEF